MTTESRAERDQKVMQLFLAGASYRQIMAAVGIKSTQTVHRIVHSEMDESAPRRSVLTDNALAVYQERTEALFRAHWGSALRGDHRSAEICRRLLDQQSRMYALGDAATTPAPATAEPDSVEDTTFDELARRRTDRGAAPAGRKRPTGSDKG